MSETEAPEVKAPKKASISAGEIMARFDALSRQLQTVWAYTCKLGMLNPEPLEFYKPKADGSGAAIQFDQRIEVTWKESGFVEDADGGVFVTLAAQQGAGDDGFARFGWQDVGTVIKAKLGTPDLAALLLGFREVRHRGKPVPKGIRPKDDTTGLTVSLFHKSPDKTNSVIELAFDESGSFFSV